MVVFCIPQARPASKLPSLQSPGCCPLAPMRCLIFPLSCALSLPLRFSLVQKHTVEFNQLAMANSEGSEVMLNRVMTKDNIGVAVLLEVRKEMMELSGKTLFFVLSYDMLALYPPYYPQLQGRRHYNLGSSCDASAKSFRRAMGRLLILW